jgi:hypothetical protein
MDRTRLARERDQREEAAEGGARGRAGGRERLDAVRRAAQIGARRSSLSPSRTHTQAAHALLFKAAHSEHKQRAPPRRQASTSLPHLSSHSQATRREHKGQNASPKPFFRPLLSDKMPICALSQARAAPLAGARCRTPPRATVPTGALAARRPRCSRVPRASAGDFFSFDEEDNQQHPPTQDARPLFTLDRASAGDNLTFEDIRCVRHS